MEKCDEFSGKLTSPRLINLSEENELILYLCSTSAYARKHEIYKFDIKTENFIQITQSKESLKIHL